MKKTVIIGGTYFNGRDFIFEFEPQSQRVTKIISGGGETKEEEFSYSEGKRKLKVLIQTVVSPNIGNIVNELAKNEHGVFHFSVNDGRVEFVNNGKFVEIKIRGGLKDSGNYMISTKKQYHWKIAEALKRLFQKYMLGDDAL